MSSPARMANQDVVNVFFEVAEQFGMAGWELVEKAGWTWLADPPQARSEPFDPSHLSTKPPGLSSAEWNALSLALGAHQPTGPAPSPTLKVTNQQIVNLFFDVAAGLGEDGWQLIERAGWTWLADPPANRNNLFSQSHLQTRPGGLTQAEWDTFLRAFDGLLLSVTGEGAPVVTTPPPDTDVGEETTVTPTREITNQEVVNVFFEVAPDFGVDGWELVEKAGWEWLAVPADNRNATFDPDRLQTKPSELSAAEWDSLKDGINTLLVSPPLEEVDWPRWWPWRRALVGLHGRGDGLNRDQDFDRFHSARIETVKYLSRAGDDPARHVQEAHLSRALSTATTGPTPIVLRPMFNFPRSQPITPETFVDDVTNHMRAFATQRDILWLVEIHNEPNVFVEGFGGTWDNGREFADWWLEVREMLRDLMPSDTRWGYPGLSPGGPSEFRGMGEREFFDQSKRAWEAADWVGAHSYWQTEAQMTDTRFGFSWKWIMDRSRKPVVITEFANTNKLTDKRVKAQEYVTYYEKLRKVKGLLGAYSFIVSVSGDEWPEQKWNNEMARIVGSRRF